MRIRTSTPPSMQSLAIVVPVFNEADGLTDLLAALIGLREELSNCKVRALFVDDHSSDGTHALLREACEHTDWFSFLRLSRRSGSHAAILAGLSFCDEDFAVFVAADLQDPPTLIPTMLELSRAGHDVVWATWQDTDDRSRIEDFFSRLFHALMCRLSNVGPLPYRASFALLSRRAYSSLVKHCDRRPSLVVEIPRLGFSVATVPFDKPSRKKGHSKWNLRRKILALADALVASTYLPLRFMTYFGMMVSGLGFSYAIFLIVRWLAGMQVTIEGWTSLMVALVILSGIQMLMLGIMGEYLWRTKEGTRRDAPFLVEDEANLRPEIEEQR